MLSTSKAKLARYGIQFDPVIINCENIEILETGPNEDEPTLDVKISKPKKVKLEPSTRKVQAKNVAKPEALPVETITLKAKKRVLRKRL